MLLQSAVTDHQILPLVQGCQRGETAAAEGLYDLYADRIYRYLLARTGDPHAAEDLTGELFVRMIEHIGRFSLNRERPAASFSAWLYRIAANLVADHHRHRRRYVDAEPEALDETDPLDLVQRSELAAQLATAMQHLTEDQRLVLIGKFADGLSNRELAVTLGKSEGAVESMQHRALRRLGSLLRGRGV
jgi:RNA polymerase sigma-70 factor (ECF subfamily)